MRCYRCFLWCSYDVTRVLRICYTLSCDADMFAGVSTQVHLSQSLHLFWSRISYISWVPTQCFVFSYGKVTRSAGVQRKNSYAARGNAGQHLRYFHPAFELPNNLFTEYCSTHFWELINGFSTCRRFETDWVLFPCYQSIPPSAFRFFQHW